MSDELILEDNPLSLCHMLCSATGQTNVPRRANLQAGVPILAFADTTVRVRTALNPKGGVEAIVDRVLLSGQAGFELFYRTGS